MKLDALQLVMGAVLLAAFVYFIRQDAIDDTLDDINDQNTEATETADETEIDLADCRASGGMWDFAAGNCIRRP